MSVEQTSQLIQLILNSVLMVTACVIALGGLLVRYTAINDQLRIVHRNYFEVLGCADLSPSDRLPQLKTQLRELRRRYRAAHRSVLVVYYALLVFVSSTFLISLRTALNLSWLIPAALVLFSVGIAVLLLGIGLTVVEFHSANLSLWDEMRSVLNLGQERRVEAMRELQKEPPGMPYKTVRRASTAKRLPPRKTGTG